MIKQLKKTMMMVENEAFALFYFYLFCISIFKFFPISLYYYPIISISFYYSPSYYSKFIIVSFY